MTTKLKETQAALAKARQAEQEARENLANFDAAMADRHGAEAWCRMVAESADDAAIAIMAARLQHWRAGIEAMLEANLAWRGRMWQTPDVAPCLGRYMRPDRKPVPWR